MAISIKKTLVGMAIIAVYGFVGEMDFRDECRTDPVCAAQHLK